MKCQDYIFKRVQIGFDDSMIFFFYLHYKVELYTIEVNIEGTKITKKKFLH